MGDWQRQQNAYELEQFQAWIPDPLDPTREFNPYTGKTRSRQGAFGGGGFGGGEQQPQVAQPQVNWGQLAGMFGGSGPAMPKAPEWSYTAPEEYTPYEFETAGMVDPSGVMKSMDPYFQEQRERGFAEAAARMGPSSRGMTASTPYSEALGGVARRSSEDINRIAAEYQYKAAEEAAARQLQQQLAQQQEKFGAWQTGAGMQQQAEMGRNQFGLDLYGGQLQAQGQQYQQQQDRRDQMLPIIMQMVMSGQQIPPELMSAMGGGGQTWADMNPGAGRFVG
jgi:hypothetical protein